MRLSHVFSPAAPKKADPVKVRIPIPAAEPKPEPKPQQKKASLVLPAPRKRLGKSTAPSGCRLTLFSTKLAHPKRKGSGGALRQ